MNALFHRHSVRSFQNRPVEKEKIDQLLHAAMAAPSAVNQQPWAFYVVTHKTVLEKLGKATPYSSPALRAPAAIVVMYRDDIIAPSYADIDCAIATENIWIEADELGLAGVMMAVAPDKERMAETEKALGDPQGLHAFCIFAFGYPNENDQPHPDRYDEKKVHYLI